MSLAVLLVRAAAVTALALPSPPARPLVAQPAVAATPVSTASAAGRPTGGFVMTGLALTAEQRERVREINLRYAGMRWALTGHDPMRAARDPELRARLHRNIEAMLAEERRVLTPAQRARFDRNVAEVQASRRAAEQRRREQARRMAGARG